MGICFDASWTLTFLPVPQVRCFNGRGTWWMCSTNTAVDGDKGKKWRNLQPCPRVVQVKMNMPTNKLNHLQPSSTSQLSKDGFFFKEILSPKNSWKLFCWLKPSQVTSVHRSSVGSYWSSGRDSWEVLPTPTFLDFMPQGGREVGLHLYGKPRGMAMAGGQPVEFPMPSKVWKVRSQNTMAKNSFPKKMSGVRIWVYIYKLQNKQT